MAYSRTNLLFVSHPEVRRSPLTWIVLFLFVLAIALCFASHSGGVLNLGFPALATGVGLFLYLRNPVLYLGFTWWIWFLTPWMRRMVDYQSVWHEPSPVLLTPYFVTCVTLITLIRYLPKAGVKEGLGFVLAIGSVCYGFLSGLIQNQPVPATVNFLLWLSPVLFSFHLFATWKFYSQYRKAIYKIFLWGILVMGSYGVFQYLTAPEWDRIWMENALFYNGLNSIGNPKPFEIRVFSTMNAPQPFAGTLVAGLLLLFTSSGKFGLPAAGAGYLSFLLSSARTAWLAWLCGLFCLLPLIKPKHQIRLVITIAVMTLLVIPLATMEPFSSAIVSRLQTLSNVGSDHSFNARIEGYNELMNFALTQWMGQGFGNKIVAAGEFGINDSSILPLLLSLGWLGAIPYMGGLLLLLLSSFGASSMAGMGRSDPFWATCRSIALAAFAQFGFNNVLTGSQGLILWGFLGLTCVAQCHHQAEQRGG